MEGKDDFEKQLIIERKIQRKNELEAKKGRYRNMLAEGVITLDEYRSDVTTIEEELHGIVIFPISRDFSDEIDQLFTLGRNITIVFNNEVIELEQKRKLLVDIGANIIWNEENLVFQCGKLFQCLIDELNAVKLKHVGLELKTTLADKEQKSVFGYAYPDLLNVLHNVRKKWLEVEKIDGG